MNILAIETSSPLLSVACERSDGAVMESNLEGGLYHAENLMVLVDQILTTLKLKRSGIDLIACGVGPGSFTGLRIGLAAVKGLSTGLRKKIAPVSSIDTISEGAPIQSGNLGVLLDARRGMLYAAGYQFKNGVSKKTFGDSLLSLDQVIKKMNSGTIFCGEGLHIYGAQIKEKLGLKTQFLEERFWKPRASSVLKWIKRQNGKTKFVSSIRLIPTYLRLSEAEEKRKAKV